jgi:CPA2 family monovalent cation:H+ antiporter-2
MQVVAILLAGAAFAMALAKAIRVPAIPLLLLTGVLLANAGGLPADDLQDTIALGAAFLLFVGGLELNPGRAGAQLRPAIRVGSAQFFLLGFAGFGAARLLGFDLITSFYLALALTASSTLVVVRLLQRRGQLFEPFGRLVLGTLLLQDLLIILIVPLVAQFTFGVGSILRGLGATLALFALAFLCLRLVTPWILALRDDEESLMLAVLALLFVFVGLAEALGVSLVAGAFLAGVALSGFPVSGIVRGQLGSITDFFTALFFTALGGLIVLPTMHELARALLLALVVVVITPPLVTVMAERAGLSARAALESGLLLSQTSELSLVVALQGMVLGQITPSVFTVVAIVTALTMLLTPFITADRVTRWLLRFHPVRAREVQPLPAANHVLLVGCGAAGLPLLETLVATGSEVVVIDDDPAIIAQLREGEIPCVRGDAADPNTLAEAGIERARIIGSTIRRPRDNRLLLETAKDQLVLIRVFDDEDARWVSEHGGVPILSSETAAATFLHWFDERFGRAERETADSAPLEAR